LAIYCFIRITPTPIDLRRRSGYFSRAFSACSFVSNGLDNGVLKTDIFEKQPLLDCFGHLKLIARRMVWLLGQRDVHFCAITRT
jgi:hypothetical protein